MDVPILRLHDRTPEPTYATAGSVGFDLSTSEPVDIEPGAIALVGTGLVVATPPGWCLLVSLRSSTPRKFGVLQPHAIGIIDDSAMRMLTANDLGEAAQKAVRVVDIIRMAREAHLNVNFELPI